MNSKWHAFGIFAALSALALHAADAATLPNLYGKLWVVPAATADQTQSTPPTATPDATFRTNHIAFYGEGTTFGIAVNLDYAMTTWLDSFANVSSLVFSGLPNSALGGTAVTATTLLSDGNAGSSNGTYGTEVEVYGKINLINGETITVLIDDNVTMKIDGVVAFQSSPGWPGTAHFQYSGTTGVHQIDVLYNECCGGPGTLVVTPPKI